MPRAIKPESTTAHARESSFVSLLSGWVQQGVENFFATQRILVDLITRQNADVMHMLRERLNDPAYCPAEVLTDLTGEGVTNFVEGQKLLLNLAQQEYELVTNGVKERVGGSPAATALTDFMRRGFDTFVEMQQDILKIANKQMHNWLTAVKAGKPYASEGMVEAARESFDTFVHAQKKFLDVIADEAAKATGKNGAAKHMKTTEITELARHATDAFIEAQKKLADIAGRQVHAGLKATNRSLNMISPNAFTQLPDFTRENVKHFVNAEKALIDTVAKRAPQHKAAGKTKPRRKHPVRTIKVAHAVTA
ncbi:MAG: hypothetical protein WBQ76_07410 [Candidatus Korobacteraceae bacterium]